jgi:hypothetical protein
LKGPQKLVKDASPANVPIGKPEQAKPIKARVVEKTGSFKFSKRD